MLMRFHYILSTWAKKHCAKWVQWMLGHFLVSTQVSVSVITASYHLWKCVFSNPGEVLKGRSQWIYQAIYLTKMDAVQHSLGEPKCFPICLCTSCLSITQKMIPSLHAELVISEHERFYGYFEKPLKCTEDSKCMVICTHITIISSAVVLCCLLHSVFT